MPSPSARRVAPVISEDLKKKITAANKSKENKQKKLAVKKERESDATDEKDDFDMMIEDNKKTLADKLGSTPEQVMKKGRVKKEKKTDGMKQTKLNFGKKETNGKGKGKKIKIESEDESSKSGSDVEFKKPAVKTIASTRVARTIAKKINYSFDSEEEQSSGDEVLFDNDMLNGDAENHKETIKLSDSDDDMPMPKHEQSSEDLFDSLVGRKSDSSEKSEKPAPKPVEKRKREKIVIPDSDSDSDDFSSKVTKKAKPAAKRGRAKKPVKYESEESDYSSN